MFEMGQDKHSKNFEPKHRNLWASVFYCRCPRCRQGRLFKKNGLIVYRDMLGSNDDCEYCGLHYEIEPGFWLGSLWASYPIVVIVEMPFLFLALFAEGNMVWVWFGCMLLAFLITWPIMLRLGRSLWIHTNIRYEGN